MTTTMTDLQTGKTFVFNEALPGRDAYEEALSLGFQGTRDDWLASLKGFDFDPEAAEWENDRAYGYRAAVLYEARLWVARAPSQAVPPGSDPEVWTLLLDGAPSAALVQAIADAGQHRADADTARQQAELALSNAQAVFGQTQAAAQALSPIEAFHHIALYPEIPLGWWDTGHRLLEGAAQRALISNWSPSHLQTGGDDIRVCVPGPDTVFTDIEGTIPAQPGQTVASLRDDTDAVVAVQATAAARPTYGRHPSSGLRQRLTRSEDMSDGWLPDGVTLTEVSIAPPPGLSRVWEVRETATPAGHRVRASGGVIAAGKTYTSSIFARAGSGNSLYVTHFDTGGAWSGSATFDLAAGTTSTPATSSITPVGDGWYRCAVTTGVAASASGNGQIIWGLRGTGSYPGDADHFIYLSGRMNEIGAIVTPYQNAPQTLFDVSEVGQRSVYYLAPDGVDDSMAFATPFEGHPAYILAAAHDVAFLPEAPNEGIVFGGTGRFTKTISSGLRWRNQSVDNQVDFTTSPVAGRQVDLVQVEGPSPPKAWRNGLAAAISSNAGSLSPLSGLTQLFRAGSSYSAGRFYGGILLDRAINEPERQLLQSYLISKGGIAL